MHVACAITIIYKASSLFFKSIDISLYNTYCISHERSLSFKL